MLYRFRMLTAAYLPTGLRSVNRLDLIVYQRHRLYATSRAGIKDECRRL